jgi:large subunit ribosomal protein L25
MEKMEEVILKATPREVVGKQVKALRRQGLLPAVLYGRSFKPVIVTLDLHDSSLILPRITSSHLIDVEVNGERIKVLVREKQRHPVTGTLIHVDFLVVSMTEKLRVMVPIELTGESPAVKDFNGILVAGLEQMEVECLPQDLPERIVVDVAVLKRIGDSIQVKDIQLSAAIEVLNEPTEVIAVVTAAEEEPTAEEAALAEPEVIEKGKKEEDDF